MKRVMLFIATNLAVVLLVGIIMSVLGVNTSTTSGLLIFCALFGFGGSFVSLAMSKWIAKKTMNLDVIAQPRDAQERWLVDTVARQASAAGISMPEVAIYHADEMNAFATGPSKSNSLVAVSSGLLYQMTQDEAEAVLAHEVAHIANGDMVTMTLLQGVMNTFVMFAARIVAGIIDNFLRSDDEEGEGLGTFAYMGVVFVLDLIFGILASFVINYYSRVREYSADAGAAKLSSPQKMIAALERLKQGTTTQMPSQMAAFGISNKKSISEMLATHPPLDKRIEALRQL